MARFQNKYRIESARLKNWDYSTPWWYYITICTRNHKMYFGSIVRGGMRLNNYGEIAEYCWCSIPEHQSNVEPDEYVIMPNHVHGIIILNNVRRDVACNVSTKKSIDNKFSQISPPKNSLSVVIRSYKAAVTREIRKNGLLEFRWQSGFYDRIIRNEKELYGIRKYIKQNPLKWDLDKNIPANLEFE